MPTENGLSSPYTCIVHLISLRTDNVLAPTPSFMLRLLFSPQREASAGDSLVPHLHNGGCSEQGISLHVYDICEFGEQVGSSAMPSVVVQRLDFEFPFVNGKSGFPDVECNNLTHRLFHFLTISSSNLYKLWLNFSNLQLYYIFPALLLIVE